MGFKYEVNGQIVEFEKEPTEKDIDEAAASLKASAPKKEKAKGATDYVKDFAKSTASLADTGINLATGTLDYLAYPLARAYHGTIGGLNAEQAATKAQQETTSPKDVIGRGLNITQDPAYQNEASRRIMSGVGEAVNEYAVQPLTQATGLPQQDVASLVNTGMLATPGAVKAAVKPIKPVIAAGKEFAEGASGTFSGTIPKPGVQPEVWQKPSARQPATETYTPASQLESWRQGQTPTSQVQQVPYNTQQLQALQRTQGNVPLSGKTMQAAGEQFGQQAGQLKNWLPELGMAGVGTLMGGPVGGAIGGALPLMYKGYKAIQGAKDVNAARQLGELGFTPMTTGEAAALRSGQPHPVAGPVKPPPNYNVPTATTPKQISQQVAASKITQPTVAPVAPTGISPETQARWNQTPGYTPPANQTMPPQPVVKAPAPQPKAAPQTAIPLSDAVAKNAEMFNNIKAKKKADVLTQRETTFSPAPEYKITHLNRDKSVMYGTDTTTGMPIKLELAPNPNKLKPGEVFVKVYDVSNLKKPNEIKTFDVTGKIIK